MEELDQLVKHVTSQLDRRELGVISLEDGDSVDPVYNDFSIFDNVSRAHMDKVSSLAWKNVLTRRAMGAMVGLAVADSIGALFEMLPILESGYSFDATTCEVTSEFNRFGLKPGQWTDDTSMCLCMADSLLVNLGYNGSDMRVRFWNWWYRGYNNGFRYDESRHQSIGIGGNVKSSLADITDATPTPRYEAPGEDAGNGSLMRLAPIPLYFHADEELAILSSAESSYTTHPGSIAADACKFLGLLIVRALHRPDGSEVTMKDFVDDCVSVYLSRSDILGNDAAADIIRLLNSSELPDSKDICWNWRDPSGPFLAEALANRGFEYNGFPVNPNYFGSYCLDGLAIALHSVYHTTNFMDAITRCINFLGDADTTGAICAQIAGSFYGIGDIDMRLRQRLSQWDNSEIEVRGALLVTLGYARSLSDTSG